jgi:alpha-tubulin suppressor-like RCC1 family protein
MTTTNYKNSDGSDIGDNLVPKEYLIDRYPELLDNFRFAGLWLWGRNQYGQLGVNDIVHRSSPIQTIAGGTNWKQVSSGGYHTAAIKTDGTLWSWGVNGDGQLGINDIVHRSSPVQTIAGGTNWKLVSGGLYHTAAIKTDGTLWLWGRNQYGQLGVNDRTSRSSPVQTIAGGTNWKQVSGGFYHTAAIKTDGTLWLWGRNSYGQLGINDRTSRSSPVQTIAGGTNWKQVSSGWYHTAAITDIF